MRFSRITFIFFSTTAFVSSTPIDLSSSFPADRLDSDAAGYYNEYPHLRLRAEMLSTEDGRDGRDNPLDDGYHYVNDQTLYRHGNSHASYQNIRRRQPPRASQSASPLQQGRSPMEEQAENEEARRARRAANQRRVRARKAGKLPKWTKLTEDEAAERRKEAMKRFYARKKAKKGGELAEWAKKQRPHTRAPQPASPFEQRQSPVPPGSGGADVARKGKGRHRKSGNAREAGKGVPSTPPSSEHLPPPDVDRIHLGSSTPSQQPSSSSRQLPMPLDDLPSTPPLLPPSYFVGQQPFDHFDPFGGRIPRPSTSSSLMPLDHFGDMHLGPSTPQLPTHNPPIPQQPSPPS